MGGVGGQNVYMWNVEEGGGETVRRRRGGNKNKKVKSCSKKTSQWKLEQELCFLPQKILEHSNLPPTKLINVT